MIYMITVMDMKKNLNFFMPITKITPITVQTNEVLAA